ncbi:MAG: extracellular solute-binding protein [Oscillospiraceae bacterium]|nr:extracellular solute-binding protein [Oscillospiraceae bacterium]
MKKRLIALIILIIILLSLTVGCKSNPDDDDTGGLAGDRDEFRYVPEFISMPNHINDVRRFTFSNGIAYFATREIANAEMNISTAKIFSMDLEDRSFTELTGYKPLFPEESDIFGNTFIDNITVDNNGNIYIIETGHFSHFNLPPDFDGEIWEKYKYEEVIASHFKLLKLDNTGLELLSVDLYTLLDDWTDITSLESDDDGNIFLQSYDNIYIFDNTGALLFTLKSPYGGDTRLLKMQDGSVALSGPTYSPPHDYNFCTIDITNGLFGESIKIENSKSGIYPGGSHFDLLVNDGTALHGFNFDTEETTELLKWINSNLIGGTLKSINILNDGRILCTEQEFNFTTVRFEFRLIILTKTALSDLPEQIVLTLATVYFDQQLEEAVIAFNRYNSKYFIEVTDYSQYGTDADWTAGHTRLTTEIISGKVPDIIAVAGLPYKRYIEKGLLEDLYPFIDADPEISRDLLVEGALRAAEINGGLYQVFSNFSIHTILGNPSVLGTDTGWNMEEFIAIIEANPSATTPVGRSEGIGGIYDFVSGLVFMNLSEYVDTTNGIAHFERGEFVRLLKFAEALNSRSAFGNINDNPADKILSGAQIMEIATYFYLSPMNYAYYKAVFGGEFVFKGFPVENRNGNIMEIHGGEIAITTTCKDKEGAWEFARMFLTEKWQTDQSQGASCPTNKAVLDAIIYEAMNPSYEASGTSHGFSYKREALTREEADQLLALINSLGGVSIREWDLWNIIKEGLLDFESGKNNAEDTARIIQSRVSIYLAEQS